MKLTGEARNTRGKPILVALCPPQTPRVLTPASNPGLRAGRPAANRLSHGTTLNQKLHQIEHCLRIFLCYFISL
jgi:hypothetical protein